MGKVVSRPKCKDGAKSTAFDDWIIVTTDKRATVLEFDFLKSYVMCVGIDQQLTTLF